MVTGADQKNVSSGNLPVDDSQQLILAEAMKIVRGKTMMLPTRAHLKALAELNKELLQAVRAGYAVFAKDHALSRFDWGKSFLRAEDVAELNEAPLQMGRAIAKAEAVQS